MHKNIAISLQNISKIYKLYDNPVDRLKESLHPFNKKYHREFHALKNINLNVQKGEVLGIVGVNGAGKSTLLKIISGVLTPTTGRINTKGKINAILELGAGFKPEMTGLENIKLNLQINQLSNKSVIDEVIAFADIGVHINQPVKTYSSGMKSRLGFALATLTKPDILIVDEALSVGDTAFKLKSYEKMRTLMDSGCTVLYVSHSLQSIVQLCTKAIFLKDHRIINIGEPKDIIEEYQHTLFSKDNLNLNKLEKKNLKKKEEEYKKGYFIPELIKEPKVLKNYDIDIKDINIYDYKNRLVNILEIDEEYTIKFTVVFNESVPNVLFGIQFKSINGLFIYGIREESLINEQVNLYTKYTIRYKFKNILLKNTYYLNIAAASKMDEEIDYLIEHAECSVFKSQRKLDCDENAISEYGIVKLNGIMKIEKS